MARNDDKKTRATGPLKINPALTANTVEDAGSTLTTGQGIPLSDDDNTERAGERGPSLLEDFHFLEKIQHFDHERIPERAVHARGSGAHGVFEATADVSRYTRAKFLQKGTRTPVFVRFSTVAGEKGSTDLARDVRGFATKFYTAEGIFDIVGNNIPVFFIQDAIKFPDLIHAVKPEPDDGMPQAASAHDTFWDFVSLTPETTHMLMWVMSDRAIPRSFATMEGFGIHTFRFVNDQGAATFVKFHWKPKYGMHSVIWDEAVRISGADPDFHRRDLRERIENGQFPEWEFGVQFFTEEQAKGWPFDVLDPTKIVPEELVPVTILGRMTLNRNPDNFFAETEQVAFSPGHLVPGIDVSEDPLLQGRIFSYQDTQISRLGSPNFNELPINRSVCPIHANLRDAHMRTTVNTGKAAYTPNSVGAGCPAVSANGFVPFPAKVGGVKARVRSSTFADHFSQARLFYVSQTPVEQQHIVEAFRFELAKVLTPAIRERMVANLARVDATLAKKVGEPLGIVPDPSKGGPSKKMPIRMPVDMSPALSLMARPGQTGIAGQKIAVLVGPGSDAKQVKAARIALEREGAAVKVLGPKLGVLDGKGGAIPVDHTLPTMPAVLFDAVVLPGGDAPAAMATEVMATQFVRDMNNHLKTIIACKGADVLLEAVGVDRESPGVLWMPSSTVEWTAAIQEMAKFKHYERERLA